MKICFPNKKNYVLKKKFDRKFYKTPIFFGGGGIRKLVQIGNKRKIMRKQNIFPVLVGPKKNEKNEKRHKIYKNRQKLIIKYQKQNVMK